MTTTAQIQPNAFCLNLECNQEAYKVHVLVNGANITCDHDGQQHVLPGFRTDIYPMILNMTFSCPRISTVCPHLVCPRESKKSFSLCFFSPRSQQAVTDAAHAIIRGEDPFAFVTTFGIRLPVAAENLMDLPFPNQAR